MNRINANKAGTATSQNSESLATVAAAQGSNFQTNSDALEFATHRAGIQQSYPKRLQTLQARFALKGFELHPLTGEQLIVGRWGMFRTLPNLEAAERFFVQIGGTHG